MIWKDFVDDARELLLRRLTLFRCLDASFCCPVALGSVKIQLRTRAMPRSKYTIDARTNSVVSANPVVIAAKVASGKEIKINAGGARR